VPVAASTCPSCGAALRDAADGDIAGVTQIDPDAVLRTKRVKRSGLAAWLVGQRDAEEPAIGKVEPPSEEVRREMLRLELAAIDAELEAKTAAAAANRELGIDEEAPATEADAAAVAGTAGGPAAVGASEAPDAPESADAGSATDKPA
jgi:hypothetical protein